MGTRVLIQWLAVVDTLSAGCLRISNMGIEKRYEYIEKHRRYERNREY